MSRPRMGWPMWMLMGIVAAWFYVNARAAAPRHYDIDPAETTVSFEVRQFGGIRQRGEFDSVEGTVSLDAEAGSGHFDIAVDTRSIRTGSERTEAFLRGPSLLNVEQFAEIAYTAQDIIFENGRPERIVGTLTLRGITRPLHLKIVGFSCSNPSQQQRCIVDATAVFKRSDFGMSRYMALISDEVKLAIHGVTDETF